MSAIEVRDLTVHLGGRPVLERVSFSLEFGEMLVVVGPNGAGKTTLLRALAGVIRPESGSIEIAGQPLGTRNRRALARELAYLPQETWTEFGLTVRDVVALGRFPHTGALRPLGAEDRAAVEKAMHEADVTHLAARPLPTLSGGERRRVYVARAMAQAARILVLDEPTTALDVGHAVSVMRLLGGMASGGFAVMLSLHDLGLALRGPTRALLLGRGRLVAEGDPSAVLTGSAARETFGIELHAIAQPPAIVPG
jgi:iron complex transport system ATP-binding protein